MGSGVEWIGSRVECLGCGVEELGSGVEGLRSGVEGLGSGVLGETTGWGCDTALELKVPPPCAPRRITRRILEVRVVPFCILLDYRTTTTQNCEAVPRRVRISGS